MKVRVNGEPREVPDGTTVQALLEALGIAGTQVAVEVNAQVVRKVRHAEARLRPEDQVEIVTFVGGG